MEDWIATVIFSFTKIPSKIFQRLKPKLREKQINFFFFSESQSFRCCSNWFFQRKDPSAGLKTGGLVESLCLKKKTCLDHLQFLSPSSSWQATAPPLSSGIIFRRERLGIAGRKGGGIENSLCMAPSSELTCGTLATGPVAPEGKFKDFSMRALKSWKKLGSHTVTCKEIFSCIRLR